MVVLASLASGNLEEQTLDVVDGGKSSMVLESPSSLRHLRNKPSMVLEAHNP